MDFLTVLHVFLSVALLASQFCRAVATSSQTRAPILVAFYALTAASLLSLFAPLILKGWRPSWDTVALLASIVAVQVVTSRYWKHGTPREFQNENADCGKVG